MVRWWLSTGEREVCRRQRSKRALRILKLAWVSSHHMRVLGWTRADVTSWGFCATCIPKGSFLQHFLVKLNRVEYIFHNCRDGGINLY